jgi:hypothetical protein
MLVSPITSPAKATWIDPTDGSQQPAEHKPWSETRWQEFTPPAKNAAGDGDFVLLLEAAREAKR